ncbi:hypothetical protein ACJIZ3_008529 [Penstemon smallii]|uniref:Uncharacterized protein n=1 Tax=Penstemon smallii TaxID=265156 RepID=A0ABD3TC28_9LAMI
MNIRRQQSGSAQSEESSLNLERTYCDNLNLLESSQPPTLQAPFASGGQVSESNAAYFSWPCQITDAAEDRAHYFGNLQKGVLPETLGLRPTGLQATTLLELMTIRAFHSKLLRRFSLGTAIGFRIRRGELTDIPAILVFVARKVHRQWLSPAHCLPTALEVLFQLTCSYPKEQLYTELVDGFGGSDPCIGSGSQVASQETYGTLGAIVKSRTGNRQVGFLTNRHVAVDLDYPSQKMFHPLPPSLGPGVYLGAVERATSFIADDLWYGIFAGTNPETFVRADGAFIPFAEDFNMANVTTLVKGVGEIGDVNIIDLQSPIGSLVGKQVVKVGRSSGMTTGTIMAYSLEYNDEKGICFFTDFLVSKRGEAEACWDYLGWGQLIEGRLKLKVGQPPENWTSGVDLGRLLDLLELDIITSIEGLQEMWSIAGAYSMVAESSPLEIITTKDKSEENFAPIPLSILQVSTDDDSHHHGFTTPFGLDVVEHQFISISSCKSPVNNIDEGGKNESEEEISVSLHLGEPEPRERKQTDSPSGFKD